MGELAQALNGSHQAPLHWAEEPIGSSHATPVTFDDRISIAVEYLGDSATSSSCGGDLEVPVAVEIVTTESMLSDQGVGSLRFSGTTSPLRAQLTFAGTVVSVDAALTEAELAEAPRGTLEPHTADAPGGSANYP